MKKRITSMGLALALCLGLLPIHTLAADGTPAGQTGKDATRETYQALGLNLNADKEAAGLIAPFPKERPITSLSAVEVYAAARGANGTRWTLRDGFDRMGSGGPRDGGYLYFTVNGAGLSESTGKKVDSTLSSNSGSNSLSSGSGDDCLYAASVPVNAGEGRNNYVAEMRVYGPARQSQNQDNPGKSYGQVQVQVYKLDDLGNRKPYGDVWTMKTFAGATDHRNYMNFLNTAYAWERESLFDIEAADLDGNGSDELLVYGGNYAATDPVINILYNYGDGYSGQQTVTVPGPDDTAYTPSSGSAEVPVVSITGADLNRDGTDELLITVSSNCAYQKPSYSKAHLYSYTWEMGAREIMSIDLGSTENTTGMSFTNSAAGEFTLPGTGVKATAILMAGYHSRNSSAASTVGYQALYFDPTRGSSGQYVTTPYRTVELSGSAAGIVTGFTPNETPVRPSILPLGCANLYGLTGSSENQNDEIFLAGDVYQFDLGSGMGARQKEAFVHTNQCNTSHNHDKEKGHIWFGKVTSGCVDSDPSAHAWREAFVFPIGIHRDDTSKASDDYCWMDIGMITRADGSSDRAIFGGQEGVIAESDRGSNENCAPYISLCLPDTQSDSIRMRYVGQRTVYTNPEVYAILQASPYFADLEETYGYIGNGGTSFGTSESTGIGAGTSFSQSVGTYVSADCSLFSAGEFEASVSAEASYDYNFNKEVEYSITYNSQAGSDTDHVVVYTIPYVYYAYEAYQPDTHGIWGWHPVMMPIALQPVHSVLRSDIYDEVARNSGGLLKPVRDLVNPQNSILKSVPGHPETYHFSEIAGEQEFITEQAAESTPNNSNSDTTLSITETKSESHTIGLSTTISMQNGVGAGFLGNDVLVGVMAETQAGLSTTISSANGTEFSATVDGLPYEVKDKGYRFSWKLGVKRTDIGDGKNVWVVGYDVTDVFEPIHMPQNFQVVDVSYDSIDLSWDAGDSAAEFYEIYSVRSSGRRTLVARIPAVSGSDHYTYKMRNLSQSTRYSYQICAVDNKGESSVLSRAVEAFTLSNGVEFKFLRQPSNLKVEAGWNAIFAVDVVHTVDGDQNSVSYQWEERASKSSPWQPMMDDASSNKGVYTPTLTLKQVDSELNGYEYRCKVSNGQGDPYYAYSDAAVLSVGTVHQYAVTYAGQLDGQPISSSVGAMSAVDIAGRTISSGSNAYEQQDIMITAAAEDGYSILKWLRNGEEVAADQIRHMADGSQILTISGHSKVENVTAVYVKSPVVTFSAADARGTVTAQYGIDKAPLVSGSTAPYGATVSFKAVPEAGYKVDHWTVNGEVNPHHGSTLVLDNVLTDVRVEVSFQRRSGATTVVAGEHGSIKSLTLNGKDYTAQAAEGLELAPGTPLVAEALPDVGYEVQKWVVDGEDYPASNIFRHRIGDLGTSIEVLFMPASYAVSWTGAKVTGYQSGSRIPGGTRIQFSAEVAEGQSVTGWMVNGALLPGEKGRTLTWTVPIGQPVENAYEIRPVCGVNVFTVSLNAGPGGSAAAPGLTGSYVTMDYGKDLTVTAIPDEDHFVREWIVDGKPVTGQEEGLELSFDWNALTLKNIREPHSVNVFFQSALMDSYPLDWELKVDQETPTLNLVTYSTCKDEVTHGSYWTTSNAMQYYSWMSSKCSTRHALAVPGSRLTLPQHQPLSYKKVLQAWSVDGEIRQPGDTITINRDTEIHGIYRVGTVPMVEDEQIATPLAMSGRNSADYNDDMRLHFLRALAAGGDDWTLGLGNEKEYAAFGMKEPTVLQGMRVTGGHAGNSSIFLKLQYFNGTGRPTMNQCEDTPENEQYWTELASLKTSGPKDFGNMVPITCDKPIQYLRVIAGPNDPDNIDAGNCNISSVELFPADALVCDDPSVDLSQVPMNPVWTPPDNPTTDFAFTDVIGSPNLSETMCAPAASSDPSPEYIFRHKSYRWDCGSSDSWMVLAVPAPVAPTHMFVGSKSPARVTFQVYSQGIPTEADYQNDSKWTTLASGETNKMLQITAGKFSQYYRLKFQAETMEEKYRYYGLEFFGAGMSVLPTVTVKVNDTAIKPGILLTSDDSATFALADDTSYYVEQWLVNGQPVQGSNYELTLPRITEATKVSLMLAEGKAAPESPVLVETLRNGSVMTSVSRAAEGTTVTISAMPESGFNLSGAPIVTLTGTVSEPEPVTIPVTGLGHNQFSFSMPAEGVTVTASFVASANVPAAPDSALGGVNRITGVSTAMEYRAEGASTWLACSGTEVTGLTAGTYYVRFAATNLAPASLAAILTVSDASRGDISGNGKVDAPDSMLILRSVVGLTTLDEAAMLRADVNGNGKVDIGDAVLILRYAAGIITEFPEK